MQCNNTEVVIDTKISFSIPVYFQVGRGNIQSWLACSSLCLIKIVNPIWLYCFPVQLLDHHITHSVLKEQKSNEFFTLHIFVSTISLLNSEYVKLGYFCSILLCQITCSVIYNVRANLEAVKKKTNLLPIPGTESQFLSPSLYQMNIPAYQHNFNEWRIQIQLFYFSLWDCKRNVIAHAASETIPLVN
jgi:hypothetical protein